MRFCLSPGCSETVDGKAGYCPVHDPWIKRAPWAGSASGRHRHGSSGWAWAKLRKRVLRRDGNRCSCGAPATEIDHIVPVAVCLRQGANPDDLSNLRAICHDCHRRKTEQDRRAGMRRRSKGA